MKKRFPAAIALAIALAGPLSAQFVITVQENGEAVSVADGGTITLNAPAAGQSVTATVSVTFIGTSTGTSTAIFPTAGTILGPTSFSADAPAMTLSTFQVGTFTITYTPVDGSQANAQFLWDVNISTTETSSSGSTTTTTTPGVLSFNLTGTAPNVVVGQVPSGGGFNQVPNGGTISIVPTIIGSTNTTAVAIANNGSGPATITSIVVTGAGYQLQGAPILPFTLNTATQLEVGIQFAPLSTSAGPGSLSITNAGGSYSATLSGTAVFSLLSYQLTEGAQTSAIAPGQTITLPISTTGNPTATLQFQNTGASSLTVSSIGINGAGFSIIDEPFFPLTLLPQQSNSVTISYTPQAQSSIGRLQVGTDDFFLSGPAPQALPSYEFTGASGTQQPFQQLTVGLSLEAPYPLDLAGTLTLTDVPVSFTSDPAVQFSTGGRQVPFTIPANTLQAIFPGGSTQIGFQTGTAAGTISIAPTFNVGTTSGINVTPSNPATLQLTIPSLSPVLLNAGLSAASATGFSIAVSGYSTTLSLNAMTFKFTPSNGSQLKTTSVTIDLTEAAGTFFSSTAANGGEFLVTVPFTLSEAGASASTNLTQSIGSVSVTSSNAVGNSNTVQVTIP